MSELLPLLTPEMIKRTHTVEALPHSRAFEHLMYSNLLSRTTEHGMDKKTFLTLSSTILNGKMDKDLRKFFPLAFYDITDLHASVTESRGPFIDANVTFFANGMLRHLFTEGDYVVIEASDEHLDVTKSSLPRYALQSLLSTFLYAQQFDELNPSSPIDLDEAAIEIPRDEEAAMLERVIMTLGHHDGHSETTTIALFENDTHLIAARLTEGEYPDRSDVKTRLDLQPTNVDDLLLKTLHNNAESIKKSNGSKKDIFAELFDTRQQDERLIDPRTDYAEWVKICNDFLQVIDKPLETFAFLDA